MQEMTAQEADKGIRASWGTPYAETLPIDYSLHTSECGTVGSEEDNAAPASRVNGWLAVALVVWCAIVALWLARGAA